MISLSFLQDTVAVQVRIREGERERLQIFEGVVIAKRIEVLIHHSLLEKFQMAKVLNVSFKHIVNSLLRLRLNVKAMSEEQNSISFVKEVVNLPELKKRSNQLTKKYWAIFLLTLSIVFFKYRILNRCRYQTT